MTRRVLLPFRDADRLEPYMAAIKAGGLEPVALDVGGATVTWADEAGLVLLGGSDVNPALYGEEHHPETEASDDQRDEIELRLIDEAVKRERPILAICRGLQILNVYYGGTLVQHLPTADRHVVRTADRGLPAHAVSIDGDSLLGRIAGVAEWQVNSRHHQAAALPGEGLRITARATDGPIEALERPDRRFILGVQWHPEDQIGAWPEQLKLFTCFAQALRLG